MTRRLCRESALRLMMVGGGLMAATPAALPQGAIIPCDMIRSKNKDAKFNCFNVRSKNKGAKIPCDTVRSTRVPRFLATRSGQTRVRWERAKFPASPGSAGVINPCELRNKIGKGQIPEAPCLLRNKGGVKK